MTKYITELLTELNDNPSLLNDGKYVSNYALRTLFQYAYQPSLKMVLPEGDPPFKPDQAPLGMSPANFYQQVKKLYIFTRTDLTPVRREALFIQLLESLHPSEAKVVLAVKDQELTRVYPNLTGKAVWDAGYLTEEPVKATPKSKKKPVESKSLVVNITDGAVTKDKPGAPPPSEAPVAEAKVEKPVKKSPAKKRARTRKNET